MLAVIISIEIVNTIGNVMDDSCTSKFLNAVTKPKYRKNLGKNTIEERKAMRTSRKRRMRLKKNKDGLVKQLKQQIETLKPEGN